MIVPRRSAIIRYGFAIFAVAAGIFLLSLPLIHDDKGRVRPLMHSGSVAPLVLFSAVLASAWFGGRGPGMVATVLAVLATLDVGDTWWYPLRIVMSLAIGALVSELIGALHEARRRAEEAAERWQASDERYRRIVETADEGIWLLDASSRAVYVNSRAAEMLGLATADILGRALGEFTYTPSGGEALAQALEPVRKGRPKRFDLRLRRKDGSILWARVSASPVPFEGSTAKGEEGVGVLAMFADVTDKLEAEAALRRSESRFRSLAESGMIGVAVFDASGRVFDANAEFLRLVGRAGEDLTAGAVSVTAMTPKEYRDLDRRKLRDLRRTGVCQPYMKEYMRKDGGRVPVMVGATRLEDSDGECVSFVLDMSARRRAEEAVRFLAEAGEVLGCSLDYDVTLAGVARLAVPRLADLCVIHVLEADGHVRRIAAAHADPALEEAAEQLQHHYTPDPDAPSPVAEVLRTGRTLLYRLGPEETNGYASHDDEHLRLAHRLGVTSFMVVPLAARGPIFGVISLGVSNPARRFDAEDMALAEELARRAALAVDNARLYREARDALWRRDQVQALADALLEAAPVGVAFFDADLRYVRINRELAAVNGLTVEEHLGRRFGELLPEIAERFEPALRQVLDSGEPTLEVEIESTRVGLPGRPTHWLANYYPARGADGRVIGVGVTLSDVTEARRTVRELREAKEAAEAAGARTVSILESIADGFFALDRDWRFTYVNPQAEELLRREPGGLLGRNLWVELAESRGSSFDRNLHEAAESSTAVSFESFYTPLGLWFEVRAYPSVDGLSVYFRDVTDRHRAEEALRASEQRFRTLAETIPQMVWSARPDGWVDYYNGRWAEYTGLQPAEIEGWEWRKVMHADDVGPSMTRWQEALRDGEGAEALARFRRGSDGAYRWHLIRAEPVHGDHGVVVAWFGTCTDIDDRWRAEQGLQFLAEASMALASLDDRAALAEVAKLAVPRLADWCVVDIVELDGTLHHLAAAHADPAKLRLTRDVLLLTPHCPEGEYGYGPREILKTGKTEFVPEITPAMIESTITDPRRLQILRALGVKSYIGTPLISRGKVLGVISLIAAESGKRYGPADVALAEDLARRAALAVDNARLFGEVNKARVEAETASQAKDQFLAALSHELRTPLTPVLVGVTAMLDDPALPISVRPVLEVTRRNVELEARLIDDLLDVTRITQGKLRISRSLVDAHALVRQAVEICRGEITNARLRLDLGLSARAHHVEGDTARLQQILWNLVKNAVKFTAPGGRITLASRNGPEGRLVVEVSDTGIGIDPAVLPRIFKAFEQGDASVTKQFGGLGLGLAISRSLAEAHGGRLLAASPGRGRGATFTLELPTVAAPTAAATPLERGPATPAADQGPIPLRILLAEDNADTLRIMSRLLRERGHRVASAGGVEAALRAADHDGPFDLVISDIGLPDGSGLELMRRIQAVRPVPGIALSGYGTEDDLRKSRDAGFIAHLTKPVDFPTLEAAIRQVAAERE